MTTTTNLARYFQLDVEMSPGVWSQVPGLYDLTPKLDATIKDDSDYDSDGWGSDKKTFQKWSVEASVNRKRDVSSHAQNPAQEKLRLAAEGFDGDSTVNVRWYDKLGGPEAYSGTAMVQWERANGSTDDLDGAKITLLGQGARITLGSNPANASGKPVLVSMSLNAGSTDGGDLIVIKGNLLAAVTAVKFATTDAEGFVVIDANTIVASAPALSAGAKNVTLVNDAGTSDVVTPAGVYTYS